MFNFQIYLKVKEMFEYILNSQCDFVFVVFCNNFVGDNSYNNNNNNIN